MEKVLTFVLRLVRHGSSFAVRVFSIALKGLFTLLHTGDRRPPAGDFHHGVEVQPDFRSDTERTLGRRGLD